jgi:hypothetical protein
MMARDTLPEAIRYPITFDKPCVKKMLKSLSLRGANRHHYLLNMVHLDLLPFHKRILYRDTLYSHIFCILNVKAYGNGGFVLQLTTLPGLYI